MSCAKEETILRPRDIEKYLEAYSDKSRNPHLVETKTPTVNHEIAIEPFHTVSTAISEKIRSGKHQNV